jgi:putative transposase
MRSAGLRAQVGYKRRPGKLAIVAANRLQQDFDVDGSDRVWVTDITDIRMHEGWLYLAAVIDLFSREVVGWSMQSRMHTKLALDLLMMAVCRRLPAPGVVVHSDQGSQFSSQEWRSFLDAHSLVPSISRRGNCYDNAVADSFFHLLKTNGSGGRPIHESRCQAGHLRLCRDVL